MTDRVSAPSTSPVVRAATRDDAADAVRVLRASITQLCRDDHHDEQASLDRWLANKNVEQLCAWLSEPGSFVAVGPLRGPPL